MALPATLLDPPGSASHAGALDIARRDVQRRAAGALKTAAELQSALELQQAERILALGIPALDAVLPQGGLPQGSVIELQVRGASGAATAFALCACRAAQQAGERWHGAQMFERAQSTESPLPWCAFIDPSASLLAPGVARLGVELSRLLVVRPDPEAVERVAIRIAEAKAVSLLVIDLRGGLELRGRAGAQAVSSQRWQRTIRRLALAVKQLTTTVLLITPERSQGLPLPVAMRLELARTGAESFEIRVGKERSGRVSPPRVIPWAAFEPVLH
ncbi:MAG TPA: recombinase A [Polyangiaceae bacterium]|nr:recombinase A [Polyangiaceae bacterium]